MKVFQLHEGDRVEMLMGGAATFIAMTRHPLWPHLALVIWKLPDGEWSLDALSSVQDVGTVVEEGPVARLQNLRTALLGGER